MADTAVNTDVDGGTDNLDGLWGPYWINETTAIIVLVDGTADKLGYNRTTDGGVSWGSVTIIEAVACQQVAVWFDRETPGGTGDVLHIVYMESTNNDVNYVSLNIATDTLGSIILIDGAVTVGTSGFDNKLAITKTGNGNLLMAFRTPSEIECKRSTDSGASWTDDRADVFDEFGQNDIVLFFDANVDAGDVCCLYWDISANSIIIKMYDDSANTWTTTTPGSPLDNMKEDGIHINMDGAIRHSDGLILCCAHSDDDNPSDDLVTFQINPNSIASPTITNKTNIFTNQSESAQCCMFINQQNDDVFLAYFKGGTWGTSVDLVYHKSTFAQDMGTWSSENAMSADVAANHRRTQAGRSVGDDGGFYQPSWFDDGNKNILVNLDNDVAIAAAAAVALPELVMAPYQPA